jgi:CheY-like chemotaxis protein
VTKRVLIVDDEPIVIAMLQDAFAYFQHGHAYEITSVCSAADAFDIVLRERFDLILLDMVMPPRAGDRKPWKQGLDVLKHVRDLGVMAPVLMMTGGWDTGKEAEALIEGAIGYLHKPFDLHELDHLIALALGSGPRATGG